MDKELIKRLARESGMKRESWLTQPPRFAGLWTEEDGIHRFAALIAEECAKIADADSDPGVQAVAAAIRWKFVE